MRLSLSETISPLPASSKQGGHIPAGLDIAARRGRGRVVGRLKEVMAADWDEAAADEIYERHRA